MNDYKKEYLRWLSSDKVDEGTKAELNKIKGNEEEIKFRFISYLQFGTGGLRGTMVAGTNAMNRYTVAHATQGFANYIKGLKRENDGVVIGYDSRNNSKFFAQITASVLCANGIKTYFFDELRPTPVLSFAVRYLKCVAGVNITASHNPKEYNGYKAYFEDGAQLSLEQADEVSACISATDIFDGVKLYDFDKGVSEGKIIVVGKEIDEAFLTNVLNERVDINAIPAVAKELKIVYTPLHGAGHKLVPEALSRAGLKHFYPVKEQMVLDGNFPTVVKPNPEYEEVFTLGIKLAKEVGSDLIIANDPDADRVGVMARNKDGKFVTISGNQMGALLLDYIVSAYEENGTMPPEPYAVKTIVTTEIISKICELHNVKLYNVLTGFKFIGEVIKKHEEMGHGSYIFGFEESYGYLKGTYARDKDSVVSTLLICEMAAYYKKKNMTLCDALDSLYERYGYYMEDTTEIYMQGLDGQQKMKELMEKLRNNPPKAISGREIVSMRDYQKETIVDLRTGKTEGTGLPKSNVLYFETEGNNIVVIRPSGTEPKIKIYLLINAENKAEAEKLLAEYKADIGSWTK